ncbi:MULTISPECIES: transglutaminase family protein [Paraburkholderia]|uniref:Transglutaminase family protein n=1 Tax=Paraburkholderia madseniana TaxID=2599607 RepID=A0AAP5BIL1_9BURK|nr:MULTISPECIES: transglutaminase family protein [Paraburkholderia]MCX4149360.1 transglutaminase family protein [Paraburkholderia madseniana]MDN7152295.1 transglutaminase family protein [Paraburkholderia sp. WS6]MDQ6411177.1 transglutaminase family protein [Paraburkholderia madseniana]
MRIAIRHTSHYQYEQPVPYALQRLRLRPQSCPGQTVIDWQVTVDGVEPNVSYVDGLGNHVDFVRHERNKREIVIVAQGTIDTEYRAGIFGAVDGLTPPWVFERETPLTRAGERIKALAADLRTEDEPLQSLHALMNTIHDRIAYQPGMTDVSTDAETALLNHHGVCQDHAHVFIAVARALHMPARYVSGYLLMDGVAMQTASHAWAEAYLDGLGWVGFDAANNTCPDERYVRIATGLDYRDAMPVSGIRTGQGAETLTVELSVLPVQGQSQSQSQS